MFAFFLKILICLLVAAAIGFLMAWLLRGLALNRLREHNYRLTSDLTARDNQVAAAQTQIQDLRGKNALFERDLGVVNARIAELQSKIAAEQKHNLNLADELRVERERVVAIESVASKRTAELESAQKQFGQLAKEKDSEISRLGAQLAPLLALPATLSQRDDEIRNIQARLDETAALKGSVENELSELRSRHELTRRSADEDLARVQAQLQAAQDDLAEVGKTKDLEIARLGSQLAPLVALPAALSARESELESARQAHAKEMAELRQKFDAAQQHMRMRDADLAAVRSQLESEISAIRGRTDTEASQLKTRVSTLVGDLQSRDSTLSTLRVELDAARKTLESRSALLREAESARQSATDAVKVKDAELARLRAELSTLSVLPARVAALQSDLGAVGDERKKLESQWQETQGQLERQLAECAAARRELETELATLRKARDVPPRQFLSPPAVIDDLKHIYGVGPVLEKMLHDLGVYQFRQVALWNEADVEFFDKQLHDFHGRIEREHWIRSAQEEHYKKYGEWLGPGEPSITLPETNR